MKALIICALTTFFLVSTHTLVADQKQQSASLPIKITDFWVRSMPPGAAVTAGFFVVTNESNQDIDLVKVTSPVAKKTELHLTQHDHKTGMSKMIPQSKIHIEANSSIVFKPGSYHIMLFSPTIDHTKTQQHYALFHFSNGQTIKSTFTLKSGARHHNAHK